MKIQAESWEAFSFPPWSLLGAGSSPRNLCVSTPRPQNVPVCGGGAFNKVIGLRQGLQVEDTMDTYRQGLQVSRETPTVCAGPSVR